MPQISWLDSRHEASLYSDTLILNCTNTGHIIPVYIIITSSVLPATRSVKLRSNSSCVQQPYVNERQKRKRLRYSISCLYKRIWRAFIFPQTLCFLGGSWFSSLPVALKKLNPRLQPDELQQSVDYYLCLTQIKFAERKRQTNYVWSSWHCDEDTGFLSLLVWMDFHDQHWVGCLLLIKQRGAGVTGGQRDLQETELSRNKWKICL